MLIDPQTLNQQESHHLLTDVVIPRPIAWVSTVDDCGNYNLAPFSAYGMVSSKPMVVCFSIGNTREGKKKDTLRNVELTGEFVISVVTRDLAKKMNITSASYPYTVDEFVEADLTPVQAKKVKAPLVAESPVNMECSTLHNIPIGTSIPSYSLIIGEVLYIHVEDDWYDTQSRTIPALRAIARLGGERDLYCYGEDTFEMPRPSI
jgi:flavin reductase (DIM6/NTAB) family NADH-FMN oxidoreductase RutF